MKVLFIVAALTSVFSFAQTKRETVSEIKIGTVSCSHNRSINTETGDTIAYVYLSFQNMEYSSITDIKSVMLPIGDSYTDVADFLKDLKAAQTEMASKVSMSWDRERYDLILYDFSKSLYIYSGGKDVTGHTTLTMKQVTEMIAWFDGLVI